MASLAQGSAADREARVFNNALDHVRTTGDALLMTEFGGLDQPDPGYQRTKRMLSEADQYMIPWIYWRFPMRSDGLDAERERGLFDVLVRPYPQAIAGTPLEWNFDPATKVFKLRYSTKAVGTQMESDAWTSIFVPLRHYPHGYRVEVSGGMVKSAPNAPQLLVTAKSSVHDVTVTVLPLP